MDTEVISLQVKYTDQKDNITDFGDTLKILLREQEWMVTNVSELHGKMQEMRDATSMKCLTYGSKLVEIETKAENDFLKSSLIKDEANYWTGGKDDVTEGQWVWVSSGTTFDFLDWNTGEPNDVGGEDCMEISKHRNRKKSWNDKSCKSSLNLICEKF
uniref:C-type lectin domain family 4 member E n=1 Tax=Magallana gigas TaxID=29159 RepID=K1PVY0_MAGGI